MNISVIVVDDETTDRFIVKRRLEHADNFKAVKEATNGPEFLDMIFDDRLGVEDDDRPVLVLMDVNMPLRNGFETVEELQRRMNGQSPAKTIVIMMFTSSNNPEDRRRAEQLELVNGYIVKPFSEDDVSYLEGIYKAA